MGALGLPTDVMLLLVVQFCEPDTCRTTEQPAPTSGLTWVTKRSFWPGPLFKNYLDVFCVPLPIPASSTEVASPIVLPTARSRPTRSANDVDTIRVTKLAHPIP